MNKYVFILLLLITQKASCQYDFPDSNAIWNVNYVSSGGTPTHEMLYGLKGDTLINDTLYNKLYTLSDTTLSDENLQDYSGGLRPAGQKVWFKPAHWSSPEILLYDFTASAGDTVWHNGIARYMSNGDLSFDNGTMYSVIQNIRMENEVQTYSIIRGGDGFSDKWYEGIGSNFGLFGSIIAFPLIGDTYNMACFKNIDTVKYQNNLMCDKCFCSDLTRIEEKIINPDWISVFPNPVLSSMTIKVDKPYSKITVEIIGERGNIIYKKDVLENPIQFDNKIQGIYFVKLSVDNEIVVKKLIIE